jgi:Cu/Ag efflux pump CusA
LAAAVLAATVVLVAVGVAQLRHAPVDTLPEFMPPAVQVQTEALGLSANEVEQLITVPLEDEFNGLAYLDHIRSRSVSGLSAIELIFRPGTDIYQARQLVTERVAQGPSVVNVGTPPVIIQPLSSTGRVMMIGLSSTSKSLIDVSTLARWRVRPRLMAVPGVANVTIWGQRDKQLQVLVDPARMTSSGITLSQVINTAGDAMWTSPLTFVEASTPGADGFIDMPNQRLSIQHILPITTPRDLASVPVEDTGDRSVKLGDVTTIVEDHPPLRGDAVLKDGPGLLLVIQKFPGADTLSVTRGAQAAMDSLLPGLSGVTVDTTVFQPATFMQTALHNLGREALAGLLLLVLWLGLASRSWRVALIGLVAVALSLIGAAYVLSLRGTAVNMVTLAGLAVALGVIVDDAAVGAVTLRRRIVEPPAPGDERPRATLVADAYTETRRPLWYALLVIVLAAVPLLALHGLGGSLARPLVVSYLLAALASTVVALVVTPALAYLLLSPARRDPAPHASGARPEGRFARAGKRGLRAFLRRPIVAYLAVVILAVLGLGILPRLGSGSLFPPLRDRNLLVEWQAMPGTSLPEMERITASADARLRTVAGVSDVATNVGQALMGDQIVDVDSAETWLRVTPKADYTATVAAIQRTIDGYPGLRHTLTTYPAQALATAPANTGKAVNVRLYGTDQETLYAQAQQIRRSLSAVPGVVNMVVEAPGEEPAIQVNVNAVAAGRYGLKPGDIRRDTAVLIAGIAVGSYYQQQQIFDVTVWSQPALRQNLTDIQNLLLDTPDGTHVRLRDVATVSVERAPTEIDHDQTSRYVDVTADVSGDLDTVLRRVNERLPSVALPLGYHAEVDSSLRLRRDDDTRMLLWVLAAAAGVFLLLQAAFRSWGRALLLVVSLPLALAGGVLGAMVASRFLTVGALLGFITVLGVAVRNGTVLIRRLQSLERGDGQALTNGGGHLTGIDLVVRATRQTCYPVLVSAVALALALAPFALRANVAGEEILRPLALVVLGGLVSSTMVTLFVLPALYLRFVARSAATAPAVPTVLAAETVPPQGVAP